MSGKQSDAKKRWDAEYQRTRCRFIGVKLAYGTDEDLIAYLESKGNIQGYIRALVRADMENSK